MSYCEWCGGIARYTIEGDRVCVECAMAWIRAAKEHPERTYILAKLINEVGT